MKQILISIGIILAVIAVTIVGMYFSYNNQEISLRQEAEAQRGRIEANHDAMWKIINQQAQVADQYKTAFEEIYPELISGRYSSGDGSLMKWIQEQNPNFDTSLYQTLMESIEVQRLSFEKNQARMLDIIREHETLCKTVPGAWFIKDKTPIEYTVISSTRTKIVMGTGIDDDVELFEKKQQ